MGQYLNSKQFMVAWVSLHDNELHQEQVEALHRMHALVQSGQPFITLENTHRIPFWEDLMTYAFNQDGLVSVKEIT